MIPKPYETRESERRRLITALNKSLRELNNQLSLLDHHVALQAGLKDVDRACLDLIERDGPLTPSSLARRAGLHPATVTGILDRLQRDGWISRDRDPDAYDRRAVVVRIQRDRTAELYRLYSGMNKSIDEICGKYTNTELELLADFLRRLTNAGREATDDLAGDRKPDGERGDRSRPHQ